MKSWTSSSSSSIGTTAHCRLWPVEKCPIFSYLPPTLYIFSLPALEELFLLPLSIFSWVFLFFSSLPVLEWRSFWASYHPPISLGDLISLFFHFFLPTTNSLHLLTPSTWRSLSTSSFQLFLGLPLLLVPSSSWVKMFLASYPPPFSLGDLTSLSFPLLSILIYFLL